MIRKKGFIALTSVLVMSAVLLAIFLGTTSRSISQLNTSFGIYSEHKAKALARACAEHALLELQRSLDYSGNQSIMIGSDSCRVLPILGSGNNDRTIQTEALNLQNAYKMEVVVSEISPTIVIESWEHKQNF